MIINGLLSLLYWALYVVIAPITLLPDVSLDSSVTTAIAVASGWLGAINQIMPLATIFMVFGLVLVVENTHFVYKLIRWVYQKIPGIN